MGLISPLPTQSTPSQTSSAAPSRFIGRNRAAVAERMLREKSRRLGEFCQALRLLESLGSPQWRGHRKHEATGPNPAGEGIRRQAHEFRTWLCRTSSKGCAVCVTEVTLVTGASLSTAVLRGRLLEWCAMTQDDHCWQLLTTIDGVQSPGSEVVSWAMSNPTRKLAASCNPRTKPSPIQALTQLSHGALLRTSTYLLEPR